MNFRRGNIPPLVGSFGRPHDFGNKLFPLRIGRRHQIGNIPPVGLQIIEQFFQLELRMRFVNRIPAFVIQIFIQTGQADFALRQF